MAVGPQVTMTLNPQIDQFAHQAWLPVVRAICPPIFDGHVLALDVASFLQALAERSHEIFCPRLGSAVEGPDRGQSLLLRARRERPRCRRAAEQRDELAASDESCHLIPQPEGLRPHDSKVEPAPAVSFGPSRRGLPGLFRTACCRVPCRPGSFRRAYR